MTVPNTVVASLFGGLGWNCISRGCMQQSTFQQPHTVGFVLGGMDCFGALNE